jgi:LysM repeat protein
MTDPTEPGSSSAVALVDHEIVPGPTDAASASRICPFLLAADGDWRSALPTREHRCTAVDPPASLSVEKQRRLCLVEGHRFCATYLAARRALVPPGPDDGADDGSAEVETPPPRVRWALPRTAPVVLDRGRPSLRAMLERRSVTQLGLVGLMTLAFLVLALARLSAGDQGTGQAVASPSSVVAASPAASAALHTAPPSSSTAPSATSARTVAPSPSGATATRRYRVVAGDTLTGITARFGVSLRALQLANGIKDPSLLRVGTVLVIP